MSNEEIEKLKLYKARFEHLDKEWNRVTEELLGKEYYNYACDPYACDTCTADDLIYKYKKSKLKYKLRKLVRGLKGE